MLWYRQALKTSHWGKEAGGEGHRSYNSIYRASWSGWGTGTDSRFVVARGWWEEEELLPVGTEAALG